MRLLTDFLLCVQAAFVAEDVTSIIKESIDAVLQNQQYNHFKVGCQPVLEPVLSQQIVAEDARAAGRSVDVHLPRNLYQTFS